MHYNLLYYGHNTGFCNSINNNIDDKDESLRTIIDYTLPDVFTVNELGADSSLADRILTQVLNVSGRNYFRRANYSNNAFSSIVNMLFYDERKLTFYSQDIISRDTSNQTLVRVIDFYTLYYNNQETLLQGDTVFLHFFVIHSKAGSSTSDLADRRRESEAIMHYIEENNLVDNVLLLGDLNTKTSSEPSYLALTHFPEEEHRFFDPMNRPGPWFNDDFYTHLHTQSTRITGQCHAGGGLDDRFDFILISKALIENESKVYYLPNSYKAIGNDGARLSGNVNNPTNNSATQDVIEALYNCSDHLPVSMKIILGNETIVNTKVMEQKVLKNIVFQNPVKDEVNIFIYPKHDSDLNVFIYDALGREAHNFNIKRYEDVHRESLYMLPSGLYIVTINDRNNNFFRQSLIKN